MKRRQLIILIGILIGIIILTNLSFLQGPNFLNAPAQLFYNGGQIFGILGLLLIPIGLIWTFRLFKKKDTKHKLISIILWAIPLTFIVSTTYIANLTRDLSRTIAIKRAEPLIQEIESFKNKKGFYPHSLTNTEIKTPSTGIIGIDDFYYEKVEDNFNLTFYQNVILNFNYEIVTYDKNDNHNAKGEMKELFETGFEHWKYEIYD